MAHAAPCTYNTRLAGWMSVFFAAVTYYHLDTVYPRLPIVVPISFENGSPLQFAIKSPGLIYLPFGLQVALGVVLAAVVAVVLSQRSGTGLDPRRRAAAQYTAEAIALLAVVWIAFQAVNAWRLTELFRRTFDSFIELYVVAIITAFTATLVIGVRAVLQMRATGADAATLRAPAVEGRRPLAMAGLAALVAVGIGAPALLISIVWDMLRQL